jgi:hypothetical protein
LWSFGFSAKSLVHPQHHTVELGNAEFETFRNAPGTVDAGYRGEILVNLVNLDPTTPIEIHPGDRIAQLVIQEFVHADFAVVDSLPESDRGKGRVFVDLPLAEGAAPKVTLTAPKRARAGDELTVTASIVDEAPQLAKIRWDVDADGSFDAWGSDASRALRQPQQGPLDVLVEVLDAEGHSGRAIVRVDADTSPPPSGAAGASSVGAPPPIARGPREAPVEASGGDCGCALAPRRAGSVAAAWIAALCLAWRRRRR